MILRSTTCALLSLSFAVGEAAARDANLDLAYLAVSRDGYWQLWVSDANGKSAKQVTRSPSDKTRVSWFPDGQSVLLCDSGGNISRITIADGKELALKLEQTAVTDAVISPDGSKIAFSFSTAIDGNDIWLVEYPSGKVIKVLRQPALQHEPTWSADGKYVYFLSGNGGQAHDIWRASADGLQTEQLTVESLYHFDIAVSGGGALAYSANISGNYEIYLQETGKPAVALTNDPALDARPAFSPDGTEIIFESTRGGEMSLWKMNLATRQQKKITRGKGARLPTWYRTSMSKG